MKIAYIVPSLANKGPILVVRDLVEQMVKNGQQCSVFYFDDIREVEFMCPVYRMRFRAKISFGEFDIVHSHGLRPDAYVFLHRPRHCKTKFVTTLHNYVLRDLAFQYNPLVACVFGNMWMRLLRRHDKVIALSLDAIYYYRRWFADRYLAYAYNTRVISFTEKLSETERIELTNFKNRDVLIGVNALLTRRKGVDLLIRALAELPGYKLFIAGDGKSRVELEELAEKCKVRNRILFGGYRKDAYRYLPFYDIYAIPSRSEGFPLAMLEAANIGKPTVCSDIAIFKEIFTPEEVAFFMIEDTSSLVKSIKYATNNLELGRRMHQKYLDCYSPEKFYERYISIYQSLL